MNGLKSQLIFKAFLEKASRLFPSLKPSDLIKTYEALSHRYRHGNTDQDLKNEKEVLAYCFARLPATLTVLEKVLREYKELAQPSIQSVTDLGCGPALSALMMQEIFPTITAITAVEHNRHMVDMAQKLTQELTSVTLESADLATYFPPATDLMIFSYSLGELPEDHQRTALSRAWDNTGQALILIEPGTPKGFQTQARMRAALIEKGAHILAPCGHNAPCPLREAAKDWCHFPVNVPRSTAHQTLKKAPLSYEIEKYIYVVATKMPVLIEQKRLIRPPLKRHGHTTLDLCTAQGITRQTFTKSKNKNYAEIHDLEWGDLYEG